MTHPSGTRHPITGDGAHAWQLADGLWAWRLSDGAIVLQGDDGDVTIPAAHLPALARGLLAAHVHNGRPDA
jgi:hypothetical protein